MEYKLKILNDTDDNYIIYYDTTTFLDFWFQVDCSFNLQVEYYCKVQRRCLPLVLIPLDHLLVDYFDYIDYIVKFSQEQFPQSV